MSDASVLQARLVGALFVDRGLLTDEQLDRALELQAESGQLLGEILVTEFDISRIELASVLAEQWAELEKADAPERDEVRQEAEDEERDRVAGTPSGTAAHRRRIGEIFVERGFVSKTELDDALEAQKETEQPLGEVLIGRGSLSRLDLAGALAEQWAGIEKLRPPSPKRVEGWQQVAPVEHAAAAAQGSARETDTEAHATVVDPTLAEAVRVLGERIAGLEAQTGGATAAEWASELRASVAALAARLDGVEAQAVDAGPQDAADEIAVLRATLDELGERLSGIDGLGDRVVALEQRGGHASREDLDNVAAGLAMRVDGLGMLVDEAVAGANKVDAALETLAEVQARLDSVTAAPQRTDDAGEQVAVLGARLDEMAAARAVVDALAERLAAVEAEGTDASLQQDVADLRTRLEELASSVPAVDGLAERLAAVEAEGTAASLQQDVADLRTRLEELASSVPAVDGLAERLAAVEAEGTDASLQQDVADLRTRLEELRSSAPAADGLAERLAAIEAASTEAPWRAEVAQLRGELAELASAGRATDDLVERLTAVEAAGAAAPWRDEMAGLRSRLEELGSSVPVVGGLAERLSALESAGAQAPWHGEVAELRVRLEELGSSDQTAEITTRVAALEAAHATTPWRDEVAQLRTQLDELASSAPALDGLAERVSAMEATATERPWRKELVRLAAEIGERLDGLAGRVDEAGGTGQTLDELQSRMASLAERVESAAAATNHEHEEIAALQTRLEELASSSSTVDTFAERLAAVEANAGERPWRKELRRLAEELGGRVDGLAGALEEKDSPGREELEELRGSVAALSKRLTDTATADHGHDELTALQGQLDELRATGSEVTALAERLAAVEAAKAASPWRPELSALATRLDDLGMLLRDTPSEESIDALRDDLDVLRTSAAKAESVSVTRLAELSDRIDVVARAAEEAGASAVDRSDLERIQTLVGEIDTAAREAARTAAAAHAEGVERAGAESAARESLETALRQRIDGVAKKLRGDTGEISSRVDALALDLATTADEAVGAAELEAALSAHELRLAERLAPYDGAIAAHARQLEESAAANAAHGEELAGVERRLTTRLDETVSAATVETTSVRDELAEIASRLTGVEQHARTTPEELLGLRTELTALSERLAAAESTAATAARAGSGWTGAAAAIGKRLSAIEQALETQDDTVQPRLEQLEHRLETEISQADERTKVTEHALRKGLATLGERLVESESAYTEVGDALRRSIERLGRAIVETDVRIASRDEPEAPSRETTAYVAFAPTPDGYKLVAVDGGAPAIGDTVELDGHQTPLVATRIGASPIPLDERPCVYFELPSEGVAA